MIGWGVRKRVKAERKSDKHGIERVRREVAGESERLREGGGEGRKQWWAFQIPREVRQGCLLAPILFNLYLFEMVTSLNKINSHAPILTIFPIYRMFSSMIFSESHTHKFT